mgnify:CR=1 FL=1
MVRQQKNEELMAAGVTLIDPATTYVDADVVVGPDTVIYPCVFLEGSTRIGSACEIHSGSRIVNSRVGHGDDGYWEDFEFVIFYKWFKDGYCAGG